MIDLNAVKNLNVKLNIGKGNQKGEGGQGGSILIVSDEIRGRGKISAEGGKGFRGGMGGNINIISKKNKFRGKISAKGGDNKWS